MTYQPNASTTRAGRVQLATADDVTAGRTTGSTGAPLVIPPNLVGVSGVGDMTKTVYDSNDDGIISVANGGTGSSTDSGARTNLGLGSMAIQNSETVNITGGNITGIADLAIADGGTGTSNGSITGTSTTSLSFISRTATASNTNGAALNVTSGNGNGSGLGGDVNVTAGNGGTTGSGGWVNATAGNGQGSGAGGYMQYVAGNGGATGNGGYVRFYGGNGGVTSGTAGSIEFHAGTPTNGTGGSIVLEATSGVGSNRNGGNVEIYLGNKTGSGFAGQFNIYPLGGARSATLNFDSMSSSRTYTYEDRDGSVYTVGGGTVASANDFTPNAGNLTVVSGTTQINGIATAKRTTGDIIILSFQSTPTVKHNTAASAGFASLKLSGSADFVASADDTLTLVYDGTYWREIARTII